MRIQRRTSLYLRPYTIVSLLLLTVLQFAFPSGSHGQAKTAGERELNLPCEANSLAISGDDSTGWFSCTTVWNPTVSSWAGASTTVYSIDLKTSDVSRLFRASGGPVTLTPAPVGSTVVVSTMGSKRIRALLCDRHHVISILPIDPAYVFWSADGSKVYTRVT